MVAASSSGRTGLVDRILAVLVGLAVHRAAGDARSGQDRGETPRPVLAAGRVLLQHVGRAAELARHHDQRIVQHAALFQVGKQCGQRLVQTRQAEAHAVGAVAEGVAHAHVSAVHVPTAARRALPVVVGLADPAVDGDKPHARLHHPPREQQVLPERVHPVAFADLGRFAVHFKRLAAFGPRHGVVGLLAQVGPVLDVAVLVVPVRLQPAQQALCRLPNRSLSYSS